MIPSDHFVRFYNEIFKFLEKKGEGCLEDYFKAISRHQETHCMELFSKGLQGMVDYWKTIKKEENCDSEKFLDGKKVFGFMSKCPSLSKVLDNDAEPCRHYCRHCPGWVLPIMTKAGYYCMYDLVEYDMPRCCSLICEDLEEAREYKKLFLQRHPDKPEMIVANFD